VLDRESARICCRDCAHESLLAFSCTCRECCPSCPAQAPGYLDAVAGYDPARAPAAEASSRNPVTEGGKGGGLSCMVTLPLDGTAKRARARRATKYQMTRRRRERRAR
jgi:hypothetical protein